MSGGRPRPMDAAAWDARYASRDLVWSAEPNRFVVEELDGLAPSGPALDVACGEGRNALWLASRGWDVTGVDFSGEALAKGRTLAEALPEAARARVTWVRDDVLTYAPVPRSQGLVLVVYLQVRADERRTVLRSCAEALAPGGTLLVVAHDSSNLTDGYGGPPDPSVLYTADDVLADLAGLDGLDVRRAERVDRPVTTDDGVRVALDCLVRVVRTG